MNEGTDLTERKYIGERYDEESSLSYLNVRYYDPGRGQFLSQDPTFLAIGNPAQLGNMTGLSHQQVLSDLQQLNSYSYARNNPITYSDPEGEWVHIVIGAGAGIVGQYGYDVYNNIRRDGFSTKAFTSSLSDGKTYLTRAGQGSIIAATGGAAGALTTSVLGQVAIVGSTSGLVGVGGSYVLGESITPESVFFDTVVGGTTFGLVKGVPRVPGRLPSFGTQAFFTGKHTQQSALNLGVDAAANYLSAILTDISSQIRDIQQQLNKIKESSNNSSEER